MIVAIEKSVHNDIYTSHIIQILKQLGIDLYRVNSGFTEEDCNVYTYDSDKGFRGLKPEAKEVLYHIKKEHDYYRIYTLDRSTLTADDDLLVYNLFYLLK